VTRLARALAVRHVKTRTAQRESARYGRPRWKPRSRRTTSQSCKVGPASARARASADAARRSRAHETSRAVYRAGADLFRPFSRYNDLRAFRRSLRSTLIRMMPSSGIHTLFASRGHLYAFGSKFLVHVVLSLEDQNRRSLVGRHSQEEIDNSCPSQHEDGAYRGGGLSQDRSDLMNEFAGPRNTLAKSLLRAAAPLHSR
jgi:hypothetical protein